MGTGWSRFGWAVAISVLLATGAASLPAPSASALGTTASLDPLLQQALTTTQPADLLPVVVQLDHVPTALDVNVLKTTGAKVVPFAMLPDLAVQATKAQVTALAALPLVRSVWLNHSLELALHESVVQIHADAVHAEPYGITGRGVGVAVLDSGIDGNHPDLHFPEHTIQNVKLLGYQKVFADATLAVENVSDTDTTTGHGTHVAGIVGGTGAASDGYYAGVAPDANLIGLGAADGTDMLTALAGYDWILAHRAQYGIRVINNSWADDAITYDPNDPLNVASKKAHDAGITVVFAAGNDSTGGAPGGPPAGNVYNRYAWPSWVVGVGGEDKLGVLATYSSVGDATHHPDLLAPGSWIASARAITGVVTDANTTPFDLTDPLNPRMIPVEDTAYYTVNQGTSMAAPHVAGVVALMLEANPALTPDQVKALLVASATPMAGCPVAACGAGGVDALGAVRGALSLVNSAPVAALTASPSVGPAPLVSRLDASGSTDADGTVLAYRWDLEGSGVVDLTTATPVLEHTYPAGTHHPTVTVVDDDGVSSAAVSVTVVAADPPTAAAVVATRARSGQPVVFDGSASTAGSSPIVSWHWEFGDGTSSTSSSPTVSHTYAVARPTVLAWALVVTDANGVSSGTHGTIKVTP